MFKFDNIDQIREVCREFIDTACIVRNRKMPGKLPGTTYTWMFYLRNGLFNVDFMKAVSVLFLDKVYKEVGHFNFQLTGLETGSTPLLVGLPIFARLYGIDMSAFSIRKQPKEYGLLNRIEGMVSMDKPCMLVDDLCNSSMSMKIAHDVVLQHGLQVFDYAFCIVNKVNKGVHHELRQVTDMYLPPNIKMLYLFDLDEFNLRNPSH